jgi:hypothetical protein
MASARTSLIAGVAGLFAACVSEDISSGQFTCFSVGSRDECPEGLVCANDLYCRESVGTLDGSAGAAGSTADTGLPAKCSDPASWTSSVVNAESDATRPLLVSRANHADVTLTWLEAGNIWAQQPLQALAAQLSQSGNVQSFRGAWSDTSDVLGVVWIDPVLSFAALASDGSVNQVLVYSADPQEPEGKQPADAAIAAAPGGGFGIVWKGFADCARRWFGVRVDAGGTKTGALYTRLTDQPCGSFTERMAIAATSDNFVLVWADNRGQCDANAACIPSGCACAPSSTTWSPDLFWLLHDVGTDASQSTQSVAAAPGVSDHPAVSWDGSQAGIAWLDQGAVWFARASGGVVPASSVVVVSDTTASDLAPGVTAGASEFGVVWQTGADVHFAPIDASGKRYDVLVANDGRSGDGPSVAWDGTRYVVAASIQSGGIRVSSCAP